MVAISSFCVISDRSDRGVESGGSYWLRIDPIRFIRRSLGWTRYQSRFTISDAIRSSTSLIYCSQFGSSDATWRMVPTYPPKCNFIPSKPL